MKLIRKDDVTPKLIPADAEGHPAEQTYCQVIIEGPNFILRVFTVKPGGSTPHHHHPWEHETYILTGNGRVVGDNTVDVSAGDAVFVGAGETHSFENTGNEDLRFICVIPRPTG